MAWNYIQDYLLTADAESAANMAIGHIGHAHHTITDRDSRPQVTNISHTHSHLTLSILYSRR